MRVRSINLRKGALARLAVLVACLGVPLAVSAQAPPPGVFSEVQTVVAPRPGPALEPATMRSRVVQVDTQKITAARRGREVLKLNLFDDAVVDVEIRRIRPTRNGHFISGRPRGAERGEVRLVVNGPATVGTVETPEGKFTIRSAGSGRHVIRQIDSSRESFECEVQEHPAAGFAGPAQPPAISSIDPPPGGGLPSLPAQATDMPTEDGSEVRVLIVYTPAMQTDQGGAAGMRALIDLFIESANQAFEESGINPRLVLAHSALVDYASSSIENDLIRLRDTLDGHMDEVHALRNRHAADVVHLLTNAPTGRTAGISYLLQAETLSFETSAFGVTASDDERVFTHEIGHIFGARHDRYVVSFPDRAVYPYAFGYVNAGAFSAGAEESARWRTVMSYSDRCRDAGFACSWLLRFANPDQTRSGDPLGVPADSAVTGHDGPADVRRTVNNTARWVGSFRSEACADFSVSPNPHVAPVRGGEIVLEVETAPGCIWDASTDAAFFSITSASPSAGSGQVKLQVEANGTGEERSGTLRIAGNTVTLRQLAVDKGICGRTSVVADAIARAAGYSGAGECEDVTDSDLSKIGGLLLDHKGISDLREGDFEGLSSLRQLYLTHNRLSELPAGLFAGLSSLEKLYMYRNRLTALPSGLFAGLSNLEILLLQENELTELPEDLLAGLTSLEVINLDNNRLTTLPEGLFNGLSRFKTLHLEANEITGLPAGLFAGLSSLDYVDLGHNRIGELPAGLFSGLTSLDYLRLESNRIPGLPAGVFSGLTNLTHLDLDWNQLTALPAGAFDDLGQLEELELGYNRISEFPADAFAALVNLRKLNLQRIKRSSLPAGMFAGLSRLETLSFWDGELTELPVGVFAGLAGLKELDLHSNRISEFRAGLFGGLSNLNRLSAGGNYVTELPPQIFSGLTVLEDLGLYNNRLTHLPPRVFSDLTALKKLNLFRNQLGSLPDGLFHGLASLETVFLGENRVDPMPVPLTMEKAGENRFRAVARTGAPFRIVLPVRAGNAGTIENGASTVTIPAGATESEALVVNRVAGTQEAVDLDAGELPGLPPNHSGYALTRDDSLPVRILPSLLPGDAALIALAVSGGTLEPAFDTGTASYTALVANATPTVTLSPTSSNESASVTYFDGAGAALADADASTAGHQADLNVGENTISVRVTSADESATMTYTVVVTRDGAARVCVRTPQVRDLILSKVAGVNRCFGVTASHLAGIGELDLSSRAIPSLNALDFQGLAAVSNLNLNNNAISSLPAGVLAGLGELRELSLNRNRLLKLPPDLFSDAPRLANLNLRGNRLTELPPGIFSGLRALDTLDLRENTIDPVPMPISVEKIEEGSFKATAPAGAPFTLNLPIIVGDGGRISGGATTVTISAGTQESSPVGVTRVDGHDKAVSVDIGTLPGLPERHLGYALRKDETLPRIVLPSPRPPPPAQVTNVQVVQGLEQLSVSWDAVADANGYRVQWKSGDEDYDVLREAALQGGDTVSHTITGLTPGTEYAVRVIATKARADDGEPSGEVTGIPRAESPGQVMGVAVAAGVEQLEVSWEAVSGADGYKVQWRSGEEEYDESRQALLAGGDTIGYVIEGLAAGTEYTVRVLATRAHADDGPPSSEAAGVPQSAPPMRVTGVAMTAGVEQLEVSWTAVSDADGYKVQWKSGEEDYAESRRAEIGDGETTSHTIAGLTGGAGYTVRVIATRENAADGPPSSEVTGIPQSAPPAQVTGVAVTAGVEQLEVSWTAVPEADGYKVQWKSGGEDYDESRRAVITDGGTMAHTITGLTPGTEYTVRVIATREHADDGLPSDEVAGAPKAQPPAQVTGVAVEPGLEELEVSWDAVTNADGYKVQWKSGGEDYDEERQVALLGGETTSYTIIDLSADTEYTIRVMATRENADDGAPSEEVTATPLAADPDVNADGTLDGDDALIMYHSYASADRLGDGETGGTPALRRQLLAGYSGKADPSDDDLKGMIRKANGWRRVGVAAGGDVNDDGELDESDAFVMYYAYALANLVGDGETGGTARFRQLLLSSFANTDNPTDEDLKAMLRKANELRDDFG